MLRPGQVVILCALALLMIGVVMVSSAGMSVAPLGESTPEGVTIESILLSRTAAYMVLALVAMGVVASMPVRRLATWIATPSTFDGHPRDGLALLGWASVAIFVCLGMVYLPFLEREVNGSKRWIEITLPGLGALSAQPSEIAKWGLVFLISWYAARRGRLMDRFWSGLLPALLVVAVLSGFIVIEDLGTGVLIASVSCLILLAGGAKVWHFLLFVPPAIVAVLGAITMSPYRVRRILAFIDPYADPAGTGYHMLESLKTIAGGEGLGRGLGHGLQKFGYLPEDTTDFLFAVVCEELGVVGAAIVIALYATLVWAGVTICRRESQPMLKLLSLGVIATIGLQALINLVVVTGLGPTKGIALPLVSSGGTGWILTAAALGTLVAIDRTRVATEPEEIEIEDEAALEIVVKARTPEAVPT